MLPPEEAYPRSVQTMGSDIRALPILDSRLPETVVFPPTGDVRRLVDDPPGRAVLAVGDLFPVVEDRAEWVTYLYGTDGRWRSLTFADLGMSEFEMFGDPNPYGTLSNNGRYLAMRTRTGIGVVDLSTARVRFFEPRVGKWFSSPSWTPDGLIAQGYWENSRHHGVFIDPASGRQREWRGPHMLGISGYSAGGSAYALKQSLAGEERRIPGMIFYGPDGKPRSDLDLPFALRVGGVVGLTKDRIAFHRRPQNFKRVRQSGAVIVTNRDAIPQAILTSPATGVQWPRAFGWADAATVLLEDSRWLLAWRPDEGKVYRLTHLLGVGENPHPYLHVKVAIELVRQAR